MSRVIGIDLGTTNSCVAIIEDGQPVVIPNTGGYKTTPSIFAVTEDGKRLVGHLAKRQAITNPKHTVHAIKRLIGRDFDSVEVQEMRQRAPYELVPGPNNDTRIQIAGRVYTVPKSVESDIRVALKAARGRAYERFVEFVTSWFSLEANTISMKQAQILRKRALGL